MNEILGCAGCGFVARADSFEGQPRCPECEVEVRPMALGEARRIVQARTRNAERRRAVLAAIDVGLAPGPELNEPA
jgi:hypothetical protein